MGGGLKWPATQHWLKCGNSVLVSGIANGRRNSISTLSALSVAKWPCWKASKKNFPLFGVLKPQPTSSSKWVGEPDYHLVRLSPHHYCTRDGRCYQPPTCLTYSSHLPKWASYCQYLHNYLLPPKASAEGGLYLNGNWLLWSVYDGLL